jgi:hypothetical protein
MKSKQTKDYMETLEKETELSKGYDVITQMRVVKELLGIRGWISGEINKLEYKGVSELEYCEQSSRLKALQEFEEVISAGIKHNSIKE